MPSSITFGGVRQFVTANTSFAAITVLEWIVTVSSTFSRVSAGVRHHDRNVARARHAENQFVAPLQSLDRQ